MGPGRFSSLCNFGEVHLCSSGYFSFSGEIAFGFMSAGECGSKYSPASSSMTSPLSLVLSLSQSAVLPSPALPLVAQLFLSQGSDCTALDAVVQGGISKLFVE